MWKAKVGFYCHLYKIQTHTHTIYYLLLIGEEYSKTQWRIYVNNYWFANNKVHTQQDSKRSPSEQQILYLIK